MVHYKDWKLNSTTGKKAAEIDTNSLIKGKSFSSPDCCHYVSPLKESINSSIFHLCTQSFISCNRGLPLQEIRCTRWLWKPVISYVQLDSVNSSAIEIKCTQYKLKYQDFTLTDISMNKALPKPDVPSLLRARKEIHKLHLSSARQLCRFLCRPAVKGSFNYILHEVG